MSLHPLDNVHKDPVTIKRALLSVYDKTGIVQLAEALTAGGVEIISTGGTAAALRNANVPVTDISDVTGESEFLDGRVKTLHPSIHGALLARLNHEPDRKDLHERNIEPIQLVVVNLYPFEEATAPEDTSLSKAVEYIDIGGPTMIRASAKNVGHVTVLTSPDQYDGFLNEWQENHVIPFRLRMMFSAVAFRRTQAYDNAISEYMYRTMDEAAPENDSFRVVLPRSKSLRYGENPHQAASLYAKQNRVIVQHFGKELSYNNYLDMDAGLRMMRDFSMVDSLSASDKEADPAVAILKHTVPCGLARGKSLTDAWHRAFETDPISPFGGVVCCTHPVTLEFAKELNNVFTEIILAPSFEEAAMADLVQKKSRRLVTYNLNHASFDSEFRSIYNGALWQETDVRKIVAEDLVVATEKTPDEEEMEELLFAWKAVRHVKSNAILFSKDKQVLAIGGGQTSRIDSFDVAVRKAERSGISLEGSVVASDAFFPFDDAVEAAVSAGAKAIIQPGGSVRDNEVVDAANKSGVAMILTGFRVFRH